eukprot:2500882-Pleurochrysis_carterae.AAC.1
MPRMRNAPCAKSLKVTSFDRVIAARAEDVCSTSTPIECTCQPTSKSKRERVSGAAINDIPRGWGRDRNAGSYFKTADLTVHQKLAPLRPRAHARSILHGSGRRARDGKCSKEKSQGKETEELSGQI